MITQRSFSKKTVPFIKDQSVLPCTVSEELQEADPKQTRQRAEKEEVRGEGGAGKMVPDDHWAKAPFQTGA